MQRTFNIDFSKASGNKVSTIKAMRDLTKLGLKEAKDFCDIGWNSRAKHLLTIDPSTWTKYVEAFERNEPMMDVEKEASIQRGIAALVAEGVTVVELKAEDNTMSVEEALKIAVQGLIAKEFYGDASVVLDLLMRHSD